MPAKAAPDHFFGRVTKFVLGQGGILWDGNGKLLRSDGNGANWTIVNDPDESRDLELTHFNVNWRGGYNVEGDPLYKRPAHEISWRGEPCRNYHDGHPIARKGSFAYNAVRYISPGGDVLGGGIYVPTAGDLEGAPQVYIVAGTFDLYRKPLADLADAMVDWVDMGQIPIGAGTLGGAEMWRSVFFSPDGSKCARVSYVLTTTQTANECRQTELMEYALSPDGLSISDTNTQLTGPWTIGRTGGEGQGGNGIQFLNNGGSKLYVGVDYSPDGTLVVLEGTLAASATWDNIGNTGAFHNFDMTLSLDYGPGSFIAMQTDIDHTIPIGLRRVNADVVTEIHYIDLRISTLVYSRWAITTTSDAVGPILTSSNDLSVYIIHNGTQQIKSVYSGLNEPSPVGARSGRMYGGFASGDLWAPVLQNTGVFRAANPAPLTVAAIWPSKVGENPRWPHSDDYPDLGTDNPVPTLLLPVMALYTRQTDNSIVALPNSTHWAADNPKGGLIVFIPDDFTPPTTVDVVDGFMTGDESLSSLLASGGVTLVIDKDVGHSFAFVKR